MDYTKEFNELTETFRLELDDTVVDRMFITSKYAKVVTIKVHPSILKLFNTKDIINFAIFHHKTKTVTNLTDEELDIFIKDKMDYNTFAYMSLIYRTFCEGDINFIDSLYRLHHQTETREDGNLYQYAIPHTQTISKLWKECSV